MTDKKAAKAANAVSANNEAMPRDKTHEEEMTVHKLVGRLGKTASGVRAKITHKDEADLLKIKPMGETAVEERLSQLTRPVYDRDIIGCVMALTVAQASEGAFTRVFTSIKTYYTDYKDTCSRARVSIATHLSPQKRMQNTIPVGLRTMSIAMTSGNLSASRRTDSNN